MGYRAYLETKTKKGWVALQVTPMGGNYLTRNEAVKQGAQLLKQHRRMAKAGQLSRKFGAMKVKVVKTP